MNFRGKITVEENARQTVEFYFVHILNYCTVVTQIGILRQTNFKAPFTRAIICSTGRATRSYSNNWTHRFLLVSRNDAFNWLENTVKSDQPYNKSLV